MDRGNALLAALINFGLLACVLPVASRVRVPVSALVLGAFAAFLPLLVSAGLYAVRAKRVARHTALDPVLVSRYEPEPAGVVRRRHARQAALAMTAVVVVGAGGLALGPADPDQGGREGSGGVVPTGRVSTINVVASHVRFVPDSVDMPAGDRLVLVVTNKDPGVHDLTLETGQSTGRITHDSTVRLDVGVVRRSLTGWCRIVGHRELRMVFAVNAISGNTTP